VVIDHGVNMNLVCFLSCATFTASFTPYPVHTVILSLRRFASHTYVSCLELTQQQISQQLVFWHSANVFRQ